MSIEEFKHLASALQAIAISLAVIVGGFWTLYRFFSLQSIEKALAEVEKLKKEISAHGVLEITIVASIPEAVSNALILNILVKNVGTQKETIEWGKSTVNLCSIDPKSLNTTPLSLEAKALRHSINSRNTFSVISPNESKTFPFLATGLEPKLYLIQAKLAGSSKEMSNTKQMALSEGVNTNDAVAVWSAEVYFSMNT